MLNSQKTDKELYQNLGKLFYAVAMADKSVHNKEIEKLKAVVRKYWLDIDDTKDEYGVNAAFQIEIVFNWLLEYGEDIDMYFGEFKDFYKEHRAMFSRKMKNLILNTAHEIANAYAGKNKSELIMLAKIKLLLE